MNSKIIWPPQHENEDPGVSQNSLAQYAIDVVLGSCHTDGRSKKQLSEQIDLTVARVAQARALDDFQPDESYRWHDFLNRVISR